MKYIVVFSNLSNEQSVRTFFVKEVAEKFCKEVEGRLVVA